MRTARRRLAQLAALTVLLGLLAAGLLVSAGTAAQRKQGDVSELGAREVWWRADWARIVELSGSWAVQAEPDFTFLVPEGPACLLRLLRRSTGEVVEYRMSAKGQVALAFGWILVSPDGPLDAAGRNTHLMEERPDLGDDAFSYGSSTQAETIERIVVRGSESFRFEPGELAHHHFKAWREVDPDQSENRVEVQGIVGNTWEWPVKDRAVQTILSITARPSGFANDRVEVSEMIWKR